MFKSEFECRKTMKLEGRFRCEEINCAIEKRNCLWKSAIVCEKRNCLWKAQLSVKNATLCEKRNCLWKAQLSVKSATVCEKLQPSVKKRNYLWKEQLTVKCLRRTSSATWCVVRWQNWQKGRLLIEMLTQNNFSDLMRCEAKMAKRDAIDWNAYAEQVLQLDALWGKIRKSRDY